MARRRIDTSAYTSSSQIKERLDEIVAQVRRKDIPLESSLDLFDEAIALGSKAVDFVDTSAVAPEELASATDAQKDEHASEAPQE